MIRVCGVVEIEDEDGRVSIQPEIPFSEFPSGDREARPDENGELAWFVAELKT